MKQYLSIGLFATLLLSLNCTSKRNRADPIKTEPQTEKTKLVIPSQDTVLARYLSLFPDTSKLFSDWKQFSDYIKPVHKAFENATSPNGELLWRDDSDNSVLIKSKFAEAMGTLIFNNIKQLPKNNSSMHMLQIHANHSTISIADRLAVFETFPNAIKEGKIGKETLKVLSEYIYERNIGVDFNDFNDIDIIYLNSESGKFRSLLEHPKKYRIISFGASWCKPCLIQERQLKQAYNKIDTALIEVIGLMIDNSQNKFITYVTKEQFPWNCYRVNNGFENQIIKTLQVNGIPSNFLLDHSGKVLKQDLDVFKLLSYVDEQ